jgi:hypothetical protein
MRLVVAHADTCRIYGALGGKLVVKDNESRYRENDY